MVILKSTRSIPSRSRRDYIENHHSTFNTKKISVDDRRDWFSRYRETGPHGLLVAEEDQKILGYAYSSGYREHPIAIN